MPKQGGFKTCENHIERLMSENAEVLNRLFGLAQLLKEGMEIIVKHKRTGQEYPLIFNSNGDVCFLEGRNLKLMQTREAEFVIASKEVIERLQSWDRGVVTKIKQTMAPFADSLNELMENLEYAEKQDDPGVQLSEQEKYLDFIRRADELEDDMYRKSRLNSVLAKALVAEAYAEKSGAYFSYLRTKFKKMPLLRNLCYNYQRGQK